MSNLEQSFLRLLAQICFRLAKGERGLEKELDELTKEGVYPQIVTELAESFGLMLAQIQGREYELEETIAELKKAKALIKRENILLKTEVHDLKIEIDHVKKAQEVSRIDQSSFFKKIKKKK